MKFFLLDMEKMMIPIEADGVIWIWSMKDVSRLYN